MKGAFQFAKRSSIFVSIPLQSLKLREEFGKEDSRLSLAHSAQGCLFEYSLFKYHLFEYRLFEYHLFEYHLFEYHLFQYHLFQYGLFAMHCFKMGFGWLFKYTKLRFRVN